MAEVAITEDAANQVRGIWYFLSMSYWIVVMGLIAKLIIEISGIAKIYQEGVKEIYDGETIVVHESIKAPFSFFSAVFLSPEIRNDDVKFSNMKRHISDTDTVLTRYLLSFYVRFFGLIHSSMCTSAHSR